MIPEISTGIVTGKRSLCHKGEYVCYTLRGAMPSAGSNLPSLERNSNPPTEI